MLPGSSDGFDFSLEGKEEKQQDLDREIPQGKTLKKLFLKDQKRKHETLVSQPSLYAFFSQENSRKRQKVDAKIDALHKKEQKAPIVISYRDDGRGQGAYYDHYTMQLLTNTPTAIASTSDKSTVKLLEYLRTVTYDLRFGDEAQSRHVPPSLDQIGQSYGLLLIPGVARNTLDKRSKDYEVRKTNEHELINRATYQGQPILAICGGSWLLWEYFGGTVKEVSEHNCRAGMPRIKDSTGKIGHNIQIHRIAIEEEAATLKSAMAYGRLGHSMEVDFSVNSVHWQAPDEKQVPHNFQLSATAVQDEKLAPKNAKSEKMQPEEGTVEAFEAKHGAPILGIQWHPEAYTNNTPSQHYPSNHQHLIKYMVQAGQAFKNRKAMVAEFKQHFSPDKSFPLRETNFLVDNNEVKKFVSNKKSILEFKRVGFLKSKCKRHVNEIEAEIRMKEDYLRSKMNTNNGTQPMEVLVLVPKPS